MNLHFSYRLTRLRAYTLVEALVASSVLMVGIGAAASLSLSLVTQEEINERSARAYNYLENAVTLYQLGVDDADIEGLLPADPVIRRLRFNDWTPNVSGLGSLTGTRIRLDYYPAGATKNNSSSKDEWTGGENNLWRRVELRVLKSEKDYATGS